MGLPRTFWNVSNHGLDAAWSPAQRAAAQAWAGDGVLALREIPFPAVDPQADTAEVAALAEATVRALEAAGARPGEPVLVMGEFTLAFALVALLKARGLVPVTATTHREASEELRPDGTVAMTHRFRFVRFRRY